MELTAGTMISTFRIDSLIGKGSMGAVYLAEDVHLRRRVALKVLAPELAGDERFRRRFLLESQLAASLEHAHIVPIYAAGDEDGSLFLAMRYVDGADLRSLLRQRHHLEPRRVIALLGQVASALDAAHAIGLVHRDVKPANILISSGSTEFAYLCDFGLAKHASSVDSLTGERSFVGTVSYIAPEQIEGGPVDARADQYAVACVLFECLTGAKPYERDGELQTLFAHLREDAPRATALEPGLPTAIDDVVVRALAKEPGDRFGTCAALIVAAGDALGVEVVTRDPATQPEVTPRVFLFAGICGYTAYATEHGDEAAGRVAGAFEETVREIAGMHDGHVLEIRDDEALVVFASAGEALRIAVELQARFAGSPPARGVGIGIDAGEAMPVGAGYRGGALNVASRLCSLAGPGEVLASETVTNLAGRVDGISYGDRREERVKGLDEPVRYMPLGPTGHPFTMRRPRVLRLLARRRVVVASMLAGLVLICLAAGVAVLAGDESVAVAPHALAVFDSDSGKLKWQVPFESDPDNAIVHGRTAYVGLSQEGTMAKVDLDRRRVTGRIRLPEGQLIGPVVGNTMWTGGAHDRVRPIDLRYGSVGKPVKLDHRGIGESDAWVAAGAGSLWIAYGAPSRLARVNPGTGKVTATISLPRGPYAQVGVDGSDDFGAVAVSGTDVWTVDRNTGDLWRIDATTNQVVATGSLNGSSFVEDIVAGGGYAWVSRTIDAGVWQIDSKARPLRLVPTGVWPFAARYGTDDVWIANRNEGTVSRVDPLTTTTTSIDVGGAPTSATPAGDDLVVTLAEQGPDPYAGLEGTIATVLARDDPLEHIDPAWGDPGIADRIEIHDAIDLKLVRNDDADGDGVQSIVADGAELPTVSDGGRTWRFKIRPGYRFSPPSGAPVTAEVFRDSIERVLSHDWCQGHWWCPWVPFPSYLEDVVGSLAFRAGKADHIAGLAVEGQTLVFHLVRPLRDLAARLALQPYAAVPAGTPIIEGGITDPIPSAGPYYLASHFLNKSAVLRRNPNYPGPRKAGFDAFVFRMLIGNDPAIARIEHGEGDIVAEKSQGWGSGSPQMQRGGELERRYGNGEEPRYLRAGVSNSLYILFNTLRAPFSDVRLRKAVDLAVDRRELATFWDARPADLFLPPGVKAHRRQGTLYPLEGPRLAAARRLTHGLDRPVVLATDFRGAMIGMAEAIKRQLARIGFQVRIVADDGKRPNATRYDMILDQWLLDYLDVGVTFGPVFDAVHAGYTAYPHADVFDDPKWIARIREVERYTGERREAAYAKLDRDLAAGPAPFAMLAHSETGFFFSDRVGCKRIIGVSGSLDLAALCPL